MLADEGDYAIVQGIIALAKTFGRKTVAEGVEELGHIQVLLEMGCIYGQGYGIAYPMPAEDFLRWYKRRYADTLSMRRQGRIEALRRKPGTDALECWLYKASLARYHT